MRSASPVRRYILAAVIFCVMLGVTYAAWLHEQQKLMLERQVIIDSSMRSFTSRIEQRLAAYGLIMSGVRGLFMASRVVTRNEFHEYVDSLRLGADFVGLEGVGLAPIVPADRRAGHVAQVRSEGGLASYDIMPPGQRLIYVPQTQLEPAVGRNLLSLGLDGYTDPLRRAAMDRAADSGVMTMSGRVVLASAPGEPVRTGYVLYAPLFEKGARADTSELRRSKVTGWVFSPLNVKDLVASLYGESALGIDIRIYDGVDVSEQALIYSTSASHASPAPKGLVLTEYLAIGGQTWTLVGQAQPGAALLGSSDESLLIAVTGIFLSLVLTILTLVLATGQTRAQAMALKMTSKLRASEARFMHLSQHDVLTGLPNRALFSDRLMLAITHARRYNTKLALLYVDLDHFKPVNDSFGHYFGDQLLVVAARRMQTMMRDSDTLARIGGDEFAVILPSIVNETDAIVVAEKLRLTLEEPIELDDDQRIRVSLSIGVAFYPDHGTDETQLTKNADAALYRAKSQGRNRVEVFHET
jgi:diguanylate cyclase (GGDEF)-like protein